MSGIWWTKMEHKEDFCEHFCEMSDKEIVADIRKSINSFLKQRADGADFGAKMVKKALDRITSKHDSAVANGSLGGQATAANKKKSPQDAPNGNAGVDMHDAGNGAASKSPTSCDQFTADAPTRENGEFHDNLESATSANISAEKSGSRQSRRTGGDSVRGGQCSIVPPVRSSGPMPANVQKVYDFASLEGLDKDDAYECWYVTTAERDGNDADGNPVTNWKAFVRTWCNTRSKKRSA